jgi:hypothetical protein
MVKQKAREGYALNTFNVSESVQLFDIKVLYQLSSSPEEGMTRG